MPPNEVVIVPHYRRELLESFTSRAPSSCCATVIHSADGHAVIATNDHFNGPRRINVIDLENSIR